MKQSKNFKPGQHITVTDVAQMGICEQQLLLDEEYGKQRSKALRNLAREGERVHSHYERALVKAKDKRCFIASAIFGPYAPETELLRDFRDRYLKIHWWGRIAVALYYRISPRLVILVRRYAALHQITRICLLAVVETLAAQKNGGRDV